MAVPGRSCSEIHPANRLGLDYTAEAARLGAPPVPMIDVHTHVGGLSAVPIFKRAMDDYGIDHVYSMSPLEECADLTDALDGRIRFIAVPNYWATDNRAYEMTEGYVKRVQEYYDLGARIVKFWVAPRSIDYAREFGMGDALKLDSPSKRAVMERASSLGMYFMTHVADPDTWFKTKYADSAIYGTKAEQYEPLEMLLQEFNQPWIAAHMGGWPEDLEFLSGLLERHANLHLDTSACKWMVRELSKHSHADFIGFLTRFKGRILFGSDIVTNNDHLTPTAADTEQATKAGGPDEAYDLYASRYWALRHLFETDYQGESPIADPDLAMVEPDCYTELDAPPLHGKSVPHDLLRSIYRDAAVDLLGPLH